MDGGGDGGGLETVEFLARSRCRVRILERLSTGEEATRAELAECCSVVRTTMQRNLEALLERGLVSRDGRTYAITAGGELLTERLVAARDGAALLEDLQPVLENLPPDELTVPLEELADATIVAATTANPYAPVRHHVESMQDADHLRLVLPASSPESQEAAYASLEDGAVHDVVMSEELLSELLETPEFEEPFERVSTHENATIWSVDEPVEYYLGIVDDSVQIGVHEESGVPGALLETDSERVLEWAESRYREYKDCATPVTVD